jgi:hypothetical protein
MNKLCSFLVVALFILMTGLAHAGFTNGNFETGDFTGWQLGGNTGDSAVVGTGTDSNTGGALSTVSNGSHAARVGDQYGNFHSSSISQTVNNWQDTSVQFAWAALLQKPTNDVDHSATEAPDFSVRLLDLTAATTLYSSVYNVYNLPASFFSGVTNSVAGSEGLWQYSQWFAVNLDTSGVIGHNLQLIISATDCSLGGHGGYLYLDEVGSTPPVINTPEPLTMILLGLGLVGLAGLRKKS